jgi:hypothetical protein
VKWPGNSPDPKSTEVVWAWKKKLVDHNCTNMKQLRDAIKKVRLERMEECDSLHLHAQQDAGGHQSGWGDDYILILICILCNSTKIYTF